MPDLSFYDKQHIQRILAQQSDIAAIFNRFIMAVSPYLRQWSDSGKNNVWIRNGAIESVVDRRLVNFHSELLNNIRSFQDGAWSAANKKSDEMITRYIKGMSISTFKKEAMFGRNLQALSQLQNNADRGLNLSERVWKIADQTKSQIEFYLNSGISVGRSANRIGQDMRQLLNNPDKRFRRVRNEEGKLMLSKPMQDYHPGAGVYRSAKMNALRTAATTTNTSYRLADYERWQNIDFILGIEIQRSHSKQGPCKICDSMVGKYPKTYKFTGFHPFCICFATPILMNPDDFGDYLLTNEIPQEQIIRNIPDNSDDFVKKNGRIFSDSYWYKDNFKNNQLKIQVSNDSAKGIPEGIYLTIEKMENTIRMNKDFETAIAYDKNGNIVINKRGASYNVDFTNKECCQLKDCILTHNHPRGWEHPEKSMSRIGNSFSPADIYFAVENDLSEMRVVTPNFTFIMKRPVNGWGMELDKLKRMVKVEDEKIMGEFTKRYIEGTVTVTQVKNRSFAYSVEKYF